MKNKALLTGVLVLGAFAVGKAATRTPKRGEPGSLQDRVIGSINNSDAAEEKKEEQKQSVFRMTDEEIKVLYRLLINHNGCVKYLDTQLRADVRNLDDKYNFF